MAEPEYNVNEKYVAVWLSEEGANLFLGLSPAIMGYRWVALGFVRGQAPVGLWIELDAVQQWQRDPWLRVKNWGVNFPLSMIRWNFVIHMQELGKSKPDDRNPIGFFQR